MYSVTCNVYLEFVSSLFKMLFRSADISSVSDTGLAMQRASLKKQVDTSKNQKEKLEALCRSLQAERKSTFAGALPSQASLQVCTSSHPLVSLI